MIYIEKNVLPISVEARKYLEAWLDSDYDGEEIFREHIKKLIAKGNSGNQIWGIMHSKKLLRRYLLLEQGGVCCYCGNRIYYKEIAPVPVEHIKPKQKFKEDIFNYDNLVLSCSGGGRRIIHISENDTEDIEQLAGFYGVSVDSIEELYINDENFDQIGQAYDIENLKKGDRILIASVLDASEWHCDKKKGNKEIAITPLQKDCFDKFMYSWTDLEAIIEAKGQTKEATDSIDILGLNNNPIIKRGRKAAIERALNAKKKIVSLAKEKRLIGLKKYIEYYSKANEIHAPKLVTQDRNSYKSPFWFVTVAVLKGNTRLTI